MSLMTLTPTAQPKSNASSSPLNLTSLLAAGTIGSNTGVQWKNSGREVLYVQQGTATSTMVVAIGSTVEGEAVNSITYSGVASDVMMIGPFDSAFNDANGNVTVSFGTQANIAGVALVGNLGAF